VLWEDGLLSLRKKVGKELEPTPVPKTEWDDSNWRQEYAGMKIVSKLQRDLLENGPKSLSQSWIMQAMHNDWMKKKGYKHPEPPDVSSSLSEFFAKTKDQGI
jgi:hypothetical protein|tara:strand:- start:92 stop:397 length:306 start_codon:yes stop_codon:yes gene_type:complete